jgi:hypothetical protein
LHLGEVRSLSLALHDCGVRGLKMSLESVGCNFGMLPKTLDSSIYSYLRGCLAALVTAESICDNPAHGLTSMCLTAEILVGIAPSGLRG